MATVTALSPRDPPEPREALEAQNLALLQRCRDLERKAHSLDVINRLAASLLLANTDIDDILWDVANGAVAHLGLEDCVIYLLDENREYLVQRAAYGPKNPKEREILAPIRIRLGQGIVGTVAQTGIPELIHDTRLDPRYIADDQARLSELAVPLFSEKQVIGVLDSEHSCLSFFTEEHFHILTTIASMTAARVNRAHLDAKLRELNQNLETKIAERTQELTEAHQQSERLLLNVLPQPIAERLKRGERALAERFDAVTVLFADLVGFTAWSATLSPEEVVNRLGRVFTEFDALTERHGLEKIKTIGDAYMVVAGLPTRRQDHAQAMALLALDMVRKVEELREQMHMPELAVRIGMHSGPVVAGIIGTHKFAYDLWGDTVNMASRLESHGLPGCTQVAESTYRELAPYFQFEPRGELNMKSIGPVKTWFLKSSRSDGGGFSTRI